MADSSSSTATATATTTDKKRKRPVRKHRLDPQRARIVVVGAGLAGLSCCVALEQAGFQHVALYERDGSLETQREGYGLTLTYNPKGPLSKLNILEQVARQDCPSRSHYLFLQQQQQQQHNVDLSASAAAAAAAGGGGTAEGSKSPSIATPIGYFGNAFTNMFDNSNTDDDDDDDDDDGDDACHSKSRSRVRRRRRGYGQRGNLRVPRKTLRGILMQQLTTTQVFWNHRLIDYHWLSKEDDNDDDDDDKNSLHPGRYRIRFQKGHSGSSSNSGDDNSITTSTTTEVVADLLVAADGIRSTILQKLYTSPSSSSSSSSSSTLTTPVPIPEPFLKSLGVRLILGIADYDHPLLTERGFYTLEPTQGFRLFTMPYRSNRFDLPQQNKQPNRVMWQLSFPSHLFSSSSDGEDGGSTATTATASTLYQFALETCRTWHDPVPDMIQSTPLHTVWGTELMDRDPKDVLRHIQEYNAAPNNNNNNRNGGLACRLVVVGDALHPMSCFKGQGANQALADGPLLAKWLQQSSAEAALKGWWREAVARTAPVVQASRNAAEDLHRPLALRNYKINGCDMPPSLPIKDEYHGFAGVETEKIPRLVQKLKQEKVGPHLGGELDRRIRQVIAMHGIAAQKEETDTTPKPVDRQHHQTALTLSSDGDTQGLRQMCLAKQSAAIWDARQDLTNRSCLHLAAIHGHTSTCKWILTEIHMPVSLKRGTHKDAFGKTALDYVNESCDDTLRHVFAVIAAEEEKEASI